MYIIIKTNDSLQLPVKNENYKTFKEADTERIYLQPDYDELLEVIEI